MKLLYGHVKAKEKQEGRGNRDLLIVHWGPFEGSRIVSLQGFLPWEKKEMSRNVMPNKTEKGNVNGNGEEKRKIRSNERNLEKRNCFQKRGNWEIRKGGFRAGANLNFVKHDPGRISRENSQERVEREVLDC